MQKLLLFWTYESYSIIFYKHKGAIRIYTVLK